MVQKQERIHHESDLRGLFVGVKRVKSKRVFGLQKAERAYRASLISFGNYNFRYSITTWLLYHSIR